MALHITVCSGGCAKTFLTDPRVESFTCRKCAGTAAVKAHAAAGPSPCANGWKYLKN